MPTLHPCAQPRCGVLLLRGTARCPVHAIVRDKRYATRKERDAIIATSRCVDCGAPAEELDHVIALVNGGVEARANRVPRCVRCHRAKTRMDMGARA